jgi:hypothetical protein
LAAGDTAADVVQCENDDNYNDDNIDIIQFHAAVSAGDTAAQRPQTLQNIQNTQKHSKKKHQKHQKHKTDCCLA